MVSDLLDSLKTLYMKSVLQFLQCQTIILPTYVGTTMLGTYLDLKGENACVDLEEGKDSL